MVTGTVVGEPGMGLEVRARAPIPSTESRSPKTSSGSTVVVGRGSDALRISGTSSDREIPVSALILTRGFAGTRGRPGRKGVTLAGIEVSVVEGLVLSIPRAESRLPRSSPGTAVELGGGDCMLIIDGIFVERDRSISTLTSPTDNPELREGAGIGDVISGVDVLAIVKLAA